MTSLFHMDSLAITGMKQDTDGWESQLHADILRVSAEIFDQFPYVPGYQLRWDSNFDPGGYSDDNNYLRFTNFRYEPIIYFAED